MRNTESLQKLRDENIKIINDIADLIVENPKITITQITIKLGISRSQASFAKKLVNKTDIHRAEKRLSEPDFEPVPEIVIPDFVPTAVDVEIRGKKYKDVSEFYGIVERGGRCYNDVHFTIPRGREESSEVSF